MKASNRNKTHLPLMLLESVLEFISMAGVRQSSIRAAFERALQRNRSIREGSRNRATERLRSCGDIPAYLLRVWHRDARYLTNKDLEPRPLHMSKGRNSLVALVKRIDPDVDAAAILKTMVEVGLIQKTSDGRFLPTASAAVLPTLHPWAVEHASHSVMRLLSTVCRNASSESEVPRLLERYSYVPDLDPGESRAFVEFSRKQGQVLLDVLDDWLEQRRVKKNRGARPVSSSGISAGIHLITFVDEVSERKHFATARGRGSGAKRTVNSLPSTPA